MENDEEPVTPTTKQGDKILDPNGNVIEKPPKLFANNPGKTKQIFTGTGPDAHPYFKVEDRFKQKKRRNFDLPLRPKRASLPPIPTPTPKPIPTPKPKPIPTPKKAGFVPATTIEEAKAFSLDKGITKNFSITGSGNGS